MPYANSLQPGLWLAWQNCSHTKDSRPWQCYALPTQIPKCGWLNGSHLLQNTSNESSPRTKVMLDVGRPQFVTVSGKGETEMSPALYFSILSDHKQQIRQGCQSLAVTYPPLPAKMNDQVSCMITWYTQGVAAPRPTNGLFPQLRGF